MSQNEKSPAMRAAIAQGPPYSSPTATVGGVPTVAVDVAPCVVLLCFYISFAVINMYRFQRNRLNGKFFLPSALLFGFSMARILTCILRIVWAAKSSAHQSAASTALAAQIFVNAGILIIYIINLLFAQRILRAFQPKLGWSKGLSVAFKGLYALIGCALVLIIVFIVDGAYTLSPSFHNAQLWILRSASLYLLIFTALPLFIVPLALFLPRPENTETFGEGSMVTKAIIVITSSCLCTILAGFRAGTSWSAPRPVTNPAWYDSKAAFYTFNFMIEILVLGLYTYATRPDKLFHVPNGSSKRKTYVVPERQEGESGIDAGESDLEKKDSGLSAV